MFQKYLITGATGFLGSTVVAQLLEKNADIFALAMENDPLANELPKEVHKVIGNVCEVTSLKAFFEKADNKTCVIHCLTLFQ